MCMKGGENTDRKEQLAGYGSTDAAYQQLGAVGRNLSSAGASDTGSAINYYRGLLSGKPGAALTAATPEVATITKGGEAEKAALALPGNRAGGTNQAKAGIQTSERGQITDVVGKARAGAAGEMSKTGIAETGAGIGATKGSGDLALGVVNAVTSARQVSQQIHEQAVRDWSKLILASLTGQGGLTAGTTWGT